MRDERSLVGGPVSSISPSRSQRVKRAALTAVEQLERRIVMSAAFDVTDLTDLRNDPVYDAIDGAMPGGTKVGVAVLDTGTLTRHGDLSGNFVAYFDAVANGASYATNTGTTDVNAGADPNGHGTHTAGTVASTNPDIGVATSAGIIAVRVLIGEQDARPTFDPLTAGLRWVAENYERYNIRVVNMSLGAKAFFTTAPNPDDYGRAIDELERLGITVVTSNGNSYADAGAAGIATPAIYSTIGVINTWEDAGAGDQLPSVSGMGGDNFYAIDRQPVADQIAATSQRATLPNQVAAPGSTIYSTWNGANGLLYNTIAGTSMAAPFVSGAVALMQDAAQTFGGRFLSPDEVLTIIRQTGDTIVDAQNDNTSRVPQSNPSQSAIVPLNETGASYQRINVYNAIKRVREIVTGGSTDPTPPPEPSERTDDTNNTIASAVPIPSLDGTQNYTFLGNVGSDGTVNVGPGDVDLLELTLESPGELTVRLSPPSGATVFGATLRVFDVNGAELAIETAAGSDYPVLSTDPGSPLPAGTYYVGISSADNFTYAITDGTGNTDGITTGDYQLTVSLNNPDPNGVIEGAADVDLTNPGETDSELDRVANYFAGLIGSDPNPVDATQPRVEIGATDVDMFEVVAPDTGRLVVNTNTVAYSDDERVDTYVVVLDAAGNVIATDDDDELDLIANTAGVRNATDAFLTANVTAGQTYYVAVSTFENRTFADDPSNPYGRASTDPAAVGLYDLYLSFDNGDQNGTALTAVDLSTIATTSTRDDGAFVSTIQGTIGADFGTPLLGDTDNGGYKDVDFLYYTPTAEGLLEFEALPTDGQFEPTLALWTVTRDTNGEVTGIEQIAITDENEARLLLDVTADLVGEPLFVSITGLGNGGFNWFATGSGSGGDTGTYELNVSLGGSSADYDSVTNETISQNTPAAVGDDQTLSAFLGRDGNVATTNADIDVYSFTAPNTGAVTVRTITTLEDSADTYLRVFDATGNELAANDNASPNTSASRVTLDVIAGTTYYVGINGASANAGSYNPITGTNSAAGSTGPYTLLATEGADDTPGDGSTTVQLTPGNAGRVNYTDANGNAATITLSGPGSGTVTFGADTAAGTPTIVLNDTTTRSSVVVKSLVRGVATTLGDVTVNGSLAALNGPVALIGGTTNITGTVGKVILGGTTGVQSLTIGGAGVATTFKFANAVSDLSLTTASAIKSLAAPAWTDTDGTADAINAAAVTSLVIPGAFGANVTLSAGGAPTKSMKLGDVTGGTWTLPDGAKTVSVASTANAWSANFGAPVTSIVTRTGALGGSVLAPSVKSIKVKTDMTADVTLTGTTAGRATNVAVISVVGSIANVQIRSAGSIGKIVAAGISGSTIFAGVDPATTGLPLDPAEFVTPASIASVTLKAGPFSDTRVAAQTIKTVVVRGVVTDNAGAPFGVRAESLAKFVRYEAGTPTFTWSSRQNPILLDFEGDFVVDLYQENN